MSLEDGAIALAATLLDATTAFTGAVIQATSNDVDIVGDFAIIDISEDGATFTADGAGSFAGSISVEVAIVFAAVSVAAARQFSSDVRKQIIGASDNRLLSIATTQTAMLEPEDSPYTGRWSCQFTLEFYCKP